LSTRLKEKYEKLLQIIAEIADQSAKGIPIVVEGSKDERALRELCILGAVFKVKTGGKNFTEAAAEIEASGAREAILLLDFDRRGREATTNLKGSLERAEIKPNLVFWRALEALAGREVACIEGLASYLQTLAQKTR
jgi:5S rRNA maturation endonuclease (ribonuclease M5)